MAHAFRGYDAKRPALRIIFSPPLVFAGLVFVLAFLAGTPYAAIDFRTFLSDFRWQAGHLYEFGHYGFGLYDEYKGAPSLPPLAKNGEQTGKSAPNQFCVTETDPVACVMDGGSTIFPENHRTEFCSASAGGLATSHNSGIEIGGIWYENAQQTLNHESCWEMIARTMGFATPTAVVTSEAATRRRKPERPSDPAWP